MEGFHSLATSRHNTSTLTCQVKLHQDLELKKQEEEAALMYRYKGSPLPASTMQPKYEQMLLEDQIKRQIRKERRIMELQK